MTMVGRTRYPRLTASSDATVSQRSSGSFHQPRSASLVFDGSMAFTPRLSIARCREGVDPEGLERAFSCRAAARPAKRLATGVGSPSPLKDFGGPAALSHIDGGIHLKVSPRGLED